MVPPRIEGTFVRLMFASTSARVIRPSEQARFIAVRATHVAMYDGGPNVPKDLFFEKRLYCATSDRAAGTKCRSFANEETYPSRGLYWLREDAPSGPQTPPPLPPARSRSPRARAAPPPSAAQTTPPP